MFQTNLFKEADQLVMKYNPKTRSFIDGFKVPLKFCEFKDLAMKKINEPITQGSISTDIIKLRSYILDTRRFFKKHNIEEIGHEYDCVRMSCRVNNDDISILSTLDKVDTLFIMMKDGTFLMDRRSSQNGERIDEPVDIHIPNQGFYPHLVIYHPLIKSMAVFSILLTIEAIERKIKWEVSN